MQGRSYDSKVRGRKRKVVELFFMQGWIVNFHSGWTIFYGSFSNLRPRRKVERNFLGTCLFWSVVCYHSCILNSYSKFKGRETSLISLSFFLFTLSLFFEIPFSSFLSLHHHHLSVPFFFSFFSFDLFFYLHMCFNIFFVSLFLLASRLFSHV